MLNVERRPQSYIYPISPSSTKSSADFRSMVGTVLRNSRLIMFSTAVCLFGGLLFVLLSKPIFIAEGMLLIDAQRAAQPTGVSARPNDASELLAVDSAMVDSKVEILKSEDLSREVITKLGLTTIPDIAGGGLFSATIRAIRNLIRGPQPAGEIPASILREFASRLDIKRLRETYMISVRFKSGVPELAATVVNTLMQSYLDRETESRRNSIKTEIGWLEDRLGQLQEAITSADRTLREPPTAGRPQAELDRLRRETESYRSVYQLFLDRYTTAIQQLSFPFAQASIVAGARPPQEKSYPSTVMAMVLSALGGLIIGTGLATYLDLHDDSFRTIDQVEATLGKPVAAIMPRLAGNLKYTGDSLPRDGLWSLNADGIRLTEPKRQKSMAQILSSSAGFIRDFVRWPSRVAPPIYDFDGAHRYAVDHPMSQFAEGVRGLKNAIDFDLDDHGCRSIGFMSAIPHEGAPIAAANFAFLLARAGRNVLLIDADVRCGELSATMRATNPTTFSDVLSGRSTLPEATSSLGRNIDFVRSCYSAATPETYAELSPPVIQQIIDQAVAAYDYVVVSLPAMTPLTDFHALAPAIGALALVVRWGTTPRQAVQTIFGSAPSAYGKTLGVVLSDADLDRLAADARLPVLKIETSMAAPRSQQPMHEARRLPHA